MARFFRVSLLAAVALVVATGAFANIPDPALSTIPAAITVTPDGSFEVILVIQGAQGPVNGAFVEIEFSPEAEALVAWTNPIPLAADIPGVGPGGGFLFSKNTDANGEVRFRLAGGGCVAEKSGSVDPYVTQIRADNFVMAELNVNSPDAVTSNGELPEDLGYDICDPGTLTSEVGLADALYHTPQLKQGLVEICTNFAPGLFEPACGLEDAGVLTPYVKAGTTGTCVYTGP